MAIRQLKCDMHTHTIYSGHAYSTVRENVVSASEVGLEMLGIADHYSMMVHPTAPSAETMRNFSHFMNLDSWPRVWRGVKLLRGVEADIVDAEGHLFGYDLAITHNQSGGPAKRPGILLDKVARKVDYIIASVHGLAFADELSAAQVTDMYIGALEHPKVIGLGHIGRTGLPLELKRLAEAARDMHKLIEVNEHTFDGVAADGSEAGRCRTIAETCAEVGCQIMVSTDAHICPAVGRFPNAIALLNEIGFPEELIASRSAASFEAALDASGVGPVDWDASSLPSAM